MSIYIALHGRIIYTRPPHKQIVQGNVKLEKHINAKLFKNYSWKNATLPIDSSVKEQIRVIDSIITDSGH